MKDTTILSPNSRRAGGCREGRAITGLGLQIELRDAVRLPTASTLLLGELSDSRSNRLARDFGSNNYDLGMAMDSITRHSATRPPAQQSNIRLSSVRRATSRAILWSTAAKWSRVSASISLQDRSGRSCNASNVLTASISKPSSRACRMKVRRRMSAAP
jgi:hypothetical protein